jgi:hypothetical protein
VASRRVSSTTELRRSEVSAVRGTGCLNTLLDSQGKRGTDSYRTRGQPLQVGRDVTVDEDRVPPVVKTDELRQELGAKTVGLACNRIDS